ncbi:YcxB family protein [Scytonema sp. UIC 10036]|uniref:YcxB family protein n=1 Tax=Scytonema sp. UIC 10036 TaxID=2304196 RepID=UPI0012DA0D69|nr:YcxB family protein [Scytonema sp. UIC 10036]MUG98173.1 YcxB family protein [Scytonema sp. UIC 10036]
MQFEYRLNVNDIKEANQAHSKKVLLKYYLLVMGIIIFISILPMLTQGGISLNELLISAIVPNLVLLAFIYLVIRISRNFVLSRTWNSQPGLKNEIRVEASEEALQINTELSESKMKWLIYTHWRETPNLFMVYQSNNCFNLFPKRAFGSDEQMNEFRELLRAKLPNK